jgi:predicted extracellular nuclease
MKKTGLKLGLISAATGLSLNTHAALVINEIDYDQPGSDTAEFIELFNAGSSAVSLDSYFLDLINGSNSSSYRTIDLTGFTINANGYFVVCGDASQVANCDYNFTTSSGWLQNGSPDAVALYSDTTIIDSLSYEGYQSPFTEGDALVPEDNNVEILSIIRMPDGFDSDDNASNFQLGCITPGTANIAGAGDCSTAGVSAVPIPAAVWLFGSGLLGLVGVARRKK